MCCVLFYLCETILGGSPAVTSLQEGTDSSCQADQENLDCVLKSPYDQPGGSSSSSNSFPCSSNVTDELDDED